MHLFSFLLAVKADFLPSFQMHHDCHQHSSLSPLIPAEAEANFPYSLFNTEEYRFPNHEMEEHCFIAASFWIGSTETWALLR